MNIKLAKGYVLKGDDKCAWIVRRYKGKKTGKEVEARVTGYYASLNQLLDNLVDSELAKKDVKTLGELADAITEIRALITEMVTPLQKVFVQKSRKKRSTAKSKL
jgi:hypothetical protein